MAAAIKFKSRKAGREISRLVFAWLLLCCLALNSSPVFAESQSAKSSDLVYCPIQKMWVEKYIPKEQIKIKQPLSDVCASDKMKNQFFSDVSKKFPLLRFIPNSQTAEKLFFDYARKGKQALTAAITAPQDTPQRGIEKANTERKVGASNFQKNFDRARTEIFTLSQAARPPTAQPRISYQFNPFDALEAISRRIAPRAPPARS